jgi:Arm DNA-binding domain
LRRKLTPAFVMNPPIPAKEREIYWEPGGLGLVVTVRSRKSYVVQYRTVDRVSRRETLKLGLSLQEARREAKKIIGAAAKGADPLGERRAAAAAAWDTLQAICEEFFRLRGPKMRTAGAWERNLARLGYKPLGHRPIEQIRRSEVVRVLDGIERAHGQFMAEKIRRCLSRIFNWQSAAPTTS